MAVALEAVALEDGAAVALRGGAGAVPAMHQHPRRGLQPVSAAAHKAMLDRRRGNSSGSWDLLGIVLGIFWKLWEERNGVCGDDVAGNDPASR